MLKYNILPGHYRTRIPLGERTGIRCSPALGWQLKCLCGYTASGFKNKRELETAYTAHIKESLPICKRCNETKAFRFMSVSQTYLCKKCNTALSKERMQAYRDGGRAMKFKSHLKKKFNLTLEEYNQIFLSQNYLCAICGQPPTDPRGFSPHIDHCHKTGKIRGILCVGCNLGLGNFKDNPHRLYSAVLYLLKHMEK